MVNLYVYIDFVNENWLHLMRFVGEFEIARLVEHSQLNSIKNQCVQWYDQLCQSELFSYQSNIFRRNKKKQDTQSSPRTLESGKEPCTLTGTAHGRVYLSSKSANTWRDGD